MTQVLLALRAGARPLDVQLRAFDLGLRTYWTAAGLGAVPAESGLRHATGIEIAEQVNASVADTLAELGLKFGLAGFGSVVRDLISLLREQRVTKSTLAACPSLPDVLEDLSLNPGPSSARKPSSPGS